MQADLVQIRSIPTFSSLREPELQRIRELTRVVEFPKGETIFREGEPADQMYFGLTGKVKIVKAVGEREVILDILGFGQPIGAVAVYEEKNFPATAIALEPTTLLALHAATFFRILESEPLIVRRLLSGLTLRLMALNQRIAHMAGSVEQRIARLLLTLAERMGKSDTEGMTIPMQLTRQDIADLTGTTVETAIRVMSRWNREGVVSSTDDGFRINDPDALREAGQVLEP